ncbi:Vacuolar protein sorting/targeting protein 10 [Spathaspora sp. JA1]|nr:Vacuolar protein sorting/targeting protein 10 [Spathaspora sp. JA1]
MFIQTQEPMLLSLFVLVISLFISTVRSSYAPNITYARPPVSSIEQVYKYFYNSSNLLTFSPYPPNHLSVSFNDGESFEPIKSITRPTSNVQMDPFNRNRAFALGEDIHYISDDKGENWRQFIASFGNDVFMPSCIRGSMDNRPQISFNAANPDYLLISKYGCLRKDHEWKCFYIYYYTTDGFKTVNRLPVDNTQICKFVKSTPGFKLGNESSILCVSKQCRSSRDTHLFKSDDFFKSKSEIKVDDSGIIDDLRIENSFVVVLVKSSKYIFDPPVHLYTSKDAITFKKSNIEIENKYGEYRMNFLSSSSSLILQIFPKHYDSTSTIYYSDSSGVHFRKNLDHVSGEKIGNVEKFGGTWIANIEMNPSGKAGDNAQGSNVGPKRIVTKYSFNSGREWSLLKSNDEDCDINSGCSIHLHKPFGDEKFTTESSLDILMGVGNKGDHLISDIRSEEMKTFISRDGGA